MLKSRKELLKYISYELKTPITSMDSFSNGIVYAKLLNIIYEDFPINKIQKGLTMESKFKNVKILQTFLIRKEIKYSFSIERIIKGSPEENLYLTQFVCNLVKDKKEEGREGSFILNEENIKNVSICLLSGDKENGLTNMTEDISKYAAENITKYSTEDTTKYADEKEINVSKENAKNKKDFNVGLSELLNGLEKERDFYFKKCLKIEKVIKKNNFINKKELEDILFT